MKYRTITLLVIYVLICVSKQHNVTSQWMSFPDDLKDWCPRTSFCEEPSIDKIGTSTEVPCCSSCSCSSDCGRKRNCCRYEYDLYKLDETLDPICKPLSTAHEYSTNNEPHYHIIDKCPNRSEICMALKNVKGSKQFFFPVFSKTTGMLYFNKVCAGCHNQTDLIDLKPEVSCRKLIVSYFTSFEVIMNDPDMSKCTVNFQVPANIDLSTELCHPSIQNNCTELGIQSNKMAMAYHDRCGAFNATFRTRARTYANIYCYLCQLDVTIEPSKLLSQYEYCPAQRGGKTHQHVPFSMILDGSSELAQLELGPKDKRYPTWHGKIAGQLTSRAVFCPEGQDYYRDKCRYRGIRWYFKYLRINIELIALAAHAQVSTDDIQTFLDIDNATFEINKPGFEEYSVNVLYNNASNSSFIPYFVAMLYRENVNVRPKQFIDGVSKALKKTWVMQLNGALFLLRPTFLKFLTYERYVDLSLRPSRPYGFNEDQQELQEIMLKMLYSEVEFDHKKEGAFAFYLTKLFFCQNVELEQKEYEDRAYQLELLELDMYLEDGEYIWKLSSSGDFKPRVCLHDVAGSDSTSSSSQPNRQMSLYFLFIEVCSLGYLYIIMY